MTSWHVDEHDLRRWIAQSAPPQVAASVEQHLVDCAACVDAVGAIAREDIAQRGDLERGWARLRNAVEVPRPSCFERALNAVGMSRPDALVVASARAFRGPLLLGVLVALAFAEIANQFGNSRGEFFFLAVAPLLPTAAVAVSYDPDLEPALEQDLVTPYGAARLVVLRTVAVLALAVPAAILLGLLLPGPRAWLWLLPAIGFVAADLALSTWISPFAGLAVIGSVWVGAVLLAAERTVAATVLAWPYRSIHLVLAVVATAVFAFRARHVRGLRVGRSGR